MCRVLLGPALAWLLVTLAFESGAAGRQNTPPKPAGNLATPEITLPAVDGEVQFRTALVVPLLGTFGRTAVLTDFLAWQIATGAFREPREGDALGPDERGRSQTWARIDAGADGWFQNRALSGGYLYAVLSSARARTMILDASGYYVVRVNGEPRGGEKYGTEWVRHPVRLRAGRNEFLFQGERGRIRARLVEPAAPISFTDVDATLPDLITGATGPVWAGIRLINATEDAIDAVAVSYRAGDQSGTAIVPMPVAPLMTRKLAVPLALRSPAAEGTVKLSLMGKVRIGKREIDTPPLEIALKAVSPAAHHVRTFVSEIDGSVQYYAVAPMTVGTSGPEAAKPALVVSLHGAGVEAVNQARAYKPKDWAVIVAPTNRRPYGFDWEDWGRLDALEVLADASRTFNTDPSRTYLTGHSMGGHGAWHVGATVPDLWAAIAPSAGWRSFSSYGGGPVPKEPTPVERMLIRANQPGETAELAQNLLHYGVYVLHGDKDDNVPVAQARYMRELLGKFHPDFSYYERPGAGHWWGDECVDWPPLFEFLKAHKRLDDLETTRVEFVTANPGASARSRWVTILSQEHPLEYSRVTIDRDPKTGVFKGTTQNVSRLALDIPKTAASARIELDGSVVVLADIRRESVQDARGNVPVVLEHAESTWRVVPPPDPTQKSPQRSGGFKDAFRHRFVLVYGTRGTAEENARTYNKARFDAEMFWYRGNGSVDVVADRAFDRTKDRDRNVVLYGNADTNSVWTALLATNPVEIRNGRARVGERVFAGPGFGAYFVRPRPGSPTASVGAVAWTGPAGWVAAGAGQYFISGAGFPDLMLFSADALRKGAGGVQVIGWFGNDWTLERGDLVWAPAESAAAPGRQD